MKTRARSVAFRFGTLAMTIAAATPAASGQTGGVVWGAYFDGVQARSAAPLVEYGPAAAFGPQAVLARGPGDTFHLFARDSQERPVAMLLSGIDDSVLRRRTVAGTRLGGFYGAIGAQSLPDGGALVLRQGVARFSVDGQLLWTRRIQTERWDEPARVTRFGNGDLALTDNQYLYGTLGRWSVSRVDALTGAVREVRDFALADSYCAAVPLGSDGDDNLYLTTLCQRVGSDYRQQVLKLSPQLTTVWSTQWSGSGGTDWMPRVSLVDAHGVVMERRSPSGERELARFDQGDGSVLWSRPGQWSGLQADANGRWVGHRGDGEASRIERLDATSGAVLWSRAVAAQDPRLAVDSAQVLLAGVDTVAERGFVERMSVDDGSVLWRRDLPATAPGATFRPRDVLITGSVVRVSGADCPAASQCTIGVARLDRATGGLQAVTYPTLPQTASSDAVVDGVAWLAASLEDAEAGPRIRAKRFDRSGAVVWEQVFPVDAPRGRYQWGHVRRAADGDLLVVAGGGVCCGQFMRYSADGTIVRWSRSLIEDRFLPGEIAFGLDAADDLIVSANRNLGMGVFERWIEKLDGQTGAPRWKKTLPPQLAGSAAPAFSLIGSDVFAFEVPHFGSGCGVMLSALDGSTRWRGQCDSRVVLASTGDTMYFWGADGSLAAVAVADGQVRWSRRVTEVGATASLVSGSISGDDLYVGGSRSDLYGTTGLMAKLDRRSGTLTWVNHFDGAGPPRAELTVHELADGILLATQFDGQRRFVTRFDSTDGRFLDGRVLALDATLDEAVETRQASWGARIDGGDRFSVGEAYRPGLAAAPWVGRLLAPEDGQRGNVAVSLSPLPQRVQLGDEVALSASVSYDGGQPLSEALVFVHLGAAAASGPSADRLGVSGLACQVIGGGTCTPVATPDGIRARVDLAPGAAATLTATLRVLAQGAVPIVTEAYAPYGWIETQLLDNVVRTSLVTDRLFFASFE